MNEINKLAERRDGLRDWLKAEHPECGRDQKHLDAGSPERAYWHHGYMMALIDALRLLGFDKGREYQGGTSQAGVNTDPRNAN